MLSHKHLSSAYIVINLLFPECYFFTIFGIWLFAATHSTYLQLKQKWISASDMKKECSGNYLFIKNIKLFTCILFFHCYKSLFHSLSFIYYWLHRYITYVSLENIFKVFLLANYKNEYLSFCSSCVKKENVLLSKLM